MESHPITRGSDEADSDAEPPARAASHAVSRAAVELEEVCTPRASEADAPSTPEPPSQAPSMTRSCCINPRRSSGGGEIRRVSFAGDDDSGALCQALGEAAEDAATAATPPPPPSAGAAISNPQCNLAAARADFKHLVGWLGVWALLLACMGATMYTIVLVGANGVFRHDISVNDHIGGLLNAPFHRGPWGGAINAVEGAPEWQVRLYDVAVRIGSLPDEFIMVLAYLVMCPRSPVARRFTAVALALYAFDVGYQSVISGSGGVFLRYCTVTVPSLVIVTFVSQKLAGIPWMSAVMIVFLVPTSLIMVSYADTGDSILYYLTEMATPTEALALRVLVFPTILLVVRSLSLVTVRGHAVDNAITRVAAFDWAPAQYAASIVFVRLPWFSGLVTTSSTNPAVLGVIGCLHTVSSVMTMPHKDVYVWRLAIGKRRAEILTFAERMRQVSGSDLVLVALVDLLTVPTLWTWAHAVRGTDLSLEYFGATTRAMVMVTQFATLVATHALVRRNMGVNVLSWRPSRLALALLFASSVIQISFLVVVKTFPKMGCIRWDDEAQWATWRWPCFMNTPKLRIALAELEEDTTDELTNNMTQSLMTGVP